MTRLLLWTFLMGSIAGAWTPDEDLIEPLRPLAPYVGKTWRGLFEDPTQKEPSEPSYDVSRWERALNGRAIRILHSINDGEYGGESLVIWDSKKQSLVSFYFTTAGFYTTATLKMEGNRLISHEQVTGNENGITEVRATNELTADGRMVVRSEYFQNGRWVPGHRITYTEAPEARVIFK